MQKYDRPVICASVAIGPDNVIGLNGTMPWYSKQDLYHFKNITTPWPCIFGKTTFDNLSKKPLPNRLNVICSSEYKNEYIDGCFYASSLENAIKECSNSEKIFICGGAVLYKYAFDRNLIDVVYLSKIQSPVLQKQITDNPDAYCRFIFDISEFFDPIKWNTKPIFYPKNVLPVEPGITSAQFFKCVRER